MLQALRSMCYILAQARKQECQAQQHSLMLRAQIIIQPLSSGMTLKGALPSNAAASQQQCTGSSSTPYGALAQTAAVRLLAANSNRATA